VVILVTAATIGYAVSVFHRKLDTMATTDKLTGLANRQVFDETLARALQSRRRGARSLAVLLLDIDRFKRINDTLGHLRGDDAIRAVADTARAALRNTDLVCRWGGEELIALTFNCSLDDAWELAESLRATMEATPVFTPDDGTRLTVSIGVAAHRPGDSNDTLLTRADRALYRAKRDGRNCVRVAEGPEIPAAAAAAMVL
jgi:diguanylate cyclase (GGDEF)-like protein